MCRNDWVECPLAPSPDSAIESKVFINAQVKQYSLKDVIAHYFFDIGHKY